MRQQSAHPAGASASRSRDAFEIDGSADTLHAISAREDVGGLAWGSCGGGSSSLQTSVITVRCHLSHSCSADEFTRRSLCYQAMCAWREAVSATGHVLWCADGGCEHAPGKQQWPLHYAAGPSVPRWRLSIRCPCGATPGPWLQGHCRDTPGQLGRGIRAAGCGRVWQSTRCACITPSGPDGRRQYGEHPWVGPHLGAAQQPRRRRRGTDGGARRTVASSVPGALRGRGQQDGGINACRVGVLQQL